MMSQNGSAAGPTLRLEEIEALLRTLSGIIAAQVRRDESGTIREIRVLGSGEAAAGKVSRNVQSALLARYGFHIELERIRVVDTPTALAGDDAPGAAGPLAWRRPRSTRTPAMPGAATPAHTAAAPDRSAASVEPAAPVEPAASGERLVADGSSSSDRPASHARPAAAGTVAWSEMRRPAPNASAAREAERRPARPITPSLDAPHRNGPSIDDRSRGESRPNAPELREIEIERRHPSSVSCTLTIAWLGRSTVGRAEALDGPDATFATAARAAVEALNRASGDRALELEGVRLDHIAGRAYATVALRGRRGRDIRFLAGAAPVEHSPEEAAALAAIRAANPWIRPAED